MEDTIYGWFRKNRIVWMIIFGTIFILSIDVWNWEMDILLFGFLPIWILRLVILQLILSILIYFFVIFYWRD